MSARSEAHQVKLDSHKSEITRSNWPSSQRPRACRAHRAGNWKLVSSSKRDTNPVNFVAQLLCQEHLRWQQVYFLDWKWYEIYKFELLKNAWQSIITSVAVRLTTTDVWHTLTNWWQALLPNSPFTVSLPAEDLLDLSVGTLSKVVQKPDNLNNYNWSTNPARITYLVGKPVKKKIFFTFLCHFLWPLSCYCLIDKNRSTQANQLIFREYPKLTSAWILEPSEAVHVRSNIHPPWHPERYHDVVFTGRHNLEQRKVGNPKWKTEWL